MPDYQKSKIYKLVSDHTDEIYIGSTCQKLCQRLGGHTRGFREGINKCTSKKLFELGKVKIVLIENCPCDCKEELYKRERHYIETTNCVNKCIPGRTKSEYRLKNKDKVKEQYLKNVDNIKERKKEYYLKNKEEFSKQRKEYRLKNNDKIKERKKVRTICDCGLDINKDTIARHKRTKKHLNLMESKMELPTPSNLE